jgi:hypothetical protein
VDGNSSSKRIREISQLCHRRVLHDSTIQYGKRATWPLLYETFNYTSTIRPSNKSFYPSAPNFVTLIESVRSPCKPNIVKIGRRAAPQYINEMYRLRDFVNLRFFRGCSKGFWPTSSHDRVGLECCQIAQKAAYHEFC